MGHSSFQDEDDDEEEYEEEAGGSNRLLGFMFGNVDNSGDLDADYLDEDAKEHLAAVADKLGPSLTDIDLSDKSPHAPADAADQDYDEKAENAIDYEDIDEEYEGPETQAATEEDHLLPKKEYFTADVSSALEPKASVFDDENYDEDEENEKEQEVVVEQEEHLAVSFEVEKSPGHEVRCSSSDSEDQADGTEEFQDVPGSPEESLDSKGSTPLPVLCVEDGMVILRFSEIFGIHEPLKKAAKRDRGFETNKLRNVAKFFAHLLGTDALPWHVISYIRLTEEDTTSSSRIFIKILFQELSEHLGIRRLNERLSEPTMMDSFESIFPRDNPKNTRFSINFFTSIGLGGITENLREYLKNMPRLIMQQQEPASGSESGDESGSSSSSESGSDSSESETESSSSDENERRRRKRRRK